MTLTPAYQHNGTTIYLGDCLEIMKSLPSESVHCCISSPPYYSLRDYQTATWEGGNPACDHSMQTGTTRGGKHSTLTGGQDATAQTTQYRTVCAKCGAVRIDRQIGMEPTVQEYIAKIVAVYDEVRRILRSDGTAWLNIADSYVGGGGYYPDAPSNQKGSLQSHGNQAGQRNIKGRRGGVCLKPKNLYLVPQRLAIALQEAGWWVRSILIWSKPNPLPESVTDRPTTSHEYVLMLSRSERYWYDADAVREKTGSEMNWTEYEAKTTPGMTWVSGGKSRYAGANKHDGGKSHPACRNLRTVLTITPEPTPDSHFATYPRNLIRPFVRAATSEKGCCPTCGRGWVRNVKVRSDYPRGSYHSHQSDGVGYGRRQDGGPKSNVGTRYEQLGWQPACSCPAGEPVPCTIFDPFLGSGTTALVAREEGRHCVGIELNPCYLEICRKKLAQASLFTQEEDAP